MTLYHVVASDTDYRYYKCLVVGTTLFRNLYGECHIFITHYHTNIQQTRDIEPVEAQCSPTVVMIRLATATNDTG